MKLLEMRPMIWVDDVKLTINYYNQQKESPIDAMRLFIHNTNAVLNVRAEERHADYCRYSSSVMLCYHNLHCTENHSLISAPGH